MILATPAVMVEGVLPALDLVLVMTVSPGFGGQDFLPETLPKIRQVRALLGRRGLACQREVDGGIDPDAAPLAVKAGARVLVGGSAVFRAPVGIGAAMQALRDSVRAAVPAPPRRRRG